MKENIIVAIIFLSVAGNARASSVKQGNKLYKKGNYDQAVEYYEKALEGDPESDAVNYNLGTAHYKTGDYEKAVSFLRKSLLSDNQILRKKAHYNLGNAIYRKGSQKEQQDINSAIGSLEKSLTQYERAAQIDSEDGDISHNYEFVKGELERLKKLLQQQQQQNQNDQQQQKQPNQQQSSQDEQDSSPEQQEQDSSEDGESFEQQDDQENEKEDDSQKDLGQNNENEQQSQTSTSEDNFTQETKELSGEEVDMMLNDYQQNEEPQGLLNFMKRKGKDSPVEKDW